MSYEQQYKDLINEIASTGATGFKTLKRDEKNKLVAARLLTEPKEDFMCFLTQRSDDENALIVALVAASARTNSTLERLELAGAIVDQARSYFAPFIDEDLKAAAVADEYARGAICE